MWVALRRFVQRCGWYAYALPILVAVTVAAVWNLSGSGRPRATAGGSTQSLSTQRPSTPSPSAPPHSTRLRPMPSPARRATAAVTVGTATNSSSVEPGSGKSKAFDARRLPPGAPYTKNGTDTFRVLAGSGRATGRGGVRRYVVEVENGVTGVDIDAFARLVQTTLADRRSWTADGTVTLLRVTDRARADFSVSLTSSLTVRRLCGYEQKIETSCWENSHGASRVNLNVARWVRGATSFGQDLLTYHRYMINHEVGHALGHAHTYRCLPDGPAPVMLQQTITLKESKGRNRRLCRPNAWPYPTV